MTRLTGVIVSFVMLMALPVAAHEFWLEPDAYRVPVGAKVTAKAVNGENFEGVEYSYSERGYSRSGVVLGGNMLKVRGENGQRPAMQMPGAAEGLHVLFHASPASKIVYDDMAKFTKFLEGKKLEGILPQHAAKGFPTEKIAEGYYRFAKALVAVGNGAGSDKAVGMPFELVALTNPYTKAGPVDFQLIFNGAPAVKAPVFVFVKTGAGVKKIWLETNASGLVSVPRETGAFMVNAVKIVESGPQLKERMGAVWTTLWASHVYAVDG